MAHDHHDHQHDHGCGHDHGAVAALDHVNVRTHQLDAMVDWYHAVLGLEPGPRPDFPFPGAWLYAGELPLVHLIGVEAAPVADPDQLRIEHFAFRGAGDLDAFLERVHGLGITFRLSKVPGTGLTQVNLWDPDDNHIHVDFGTFAPA
jgi:catechol 2,3-dioxygenase-like lactoylglutathione lyase family enzyme